MKNDMRKAFGSLATDDTPMVRRAAAKALGVGKLPYSPVHILSNFVSLLQ